MQKRHHGAGHDILRLDIRYNKNEKERQRKEKRKREIVRENPNARTREREQVTRGHNIGADGWLEFDYIAISAQLDWGLG